MLVLFLSNQIWPVNTFQTSQTLLKHKEFTLNAPQLSPLSSLFSTLSGDDEERRRERGSGEIHGRPKKSGSKRSGRVERCMVEIEAEDESPPPQRNMRALPVLSSKSSCVYSRQIYHL